MNNYEDWAQLVAKNLKGEGDLLAAIDKEELDDAAATEAFIRAVLEPFLPESFGIGSGRVVDSDGNYSDFLDIVIYNRDYPGIGLRGTQSVYLYESVLAVFAIRAKFIRKTFFDALTSCASLSDLKANIDKLTLAKMAKKNGLVRDSRNRFVHRDPLHTARFNMLGRPPAFVFGFVGMKQSYRQLQENIELWLEQRRKVGAEAEMKCLPAVIATQGCFAWRNAAPLSLSSRDMLGIGNDSAPVRLIILQLLYLLNRRLGIGGDAYGLKPNLKSYLNQFSPPHFDVGAGSIADVTSLKAATDPEQQSIDTAAASQRLTPARDHSKSPRTAAAKKKAAPPRATPPTEPVAKAPAEPKPEAPPEPKQEAKPAVEAKPKAEATSTAAPSKPGPEAKTKAPQPQATAEPASAPEPKAETAPAAEPKPAPAAPEGPKAPPLGAAPIPMANAEDSMPVPTLPDADDVGVPEKKPAAAGSTADKRVTAVIPPKPPVDIELFGDADDTNDPVASATPAASAKPAQEESDLSKTVVVPPPNESQGEGPTGNSTDAFIARVKQQLSSTDPIEDPDKGRGPYTSTIPH